MKRDNTKSVTAAVLIAAPPELVWSVWSRFGNVQDYVVIVPKSYLTGECESGLGTTRRCEISETVTVDERITDWRPGESYSLEVTRAVGAPIQNMFMALIDPLRRLLVYPDMIRRIERSWPRMWSNGAPV